MCLFDWLVDFTVLAPNGFGKPLTLSKINVRISEQVQPEASRQSQEMASRAGVSNSFLPGATSTSQLPSESESF